MRVLAPLAFVVVLSSVISVAHASGWTYYVPPPVYDHKGITIVSKEIKLGPTDGKLWVNAVVANHTGKEVMVDLNQIFAQRLDGSTTARSTSVFSGANKPVVIPAGLSTTVKVEYVISKKPEPVELVMKQAFIASGKALPLPNYPIDPVGDPKYIALKKDKIELKQKVHFATDKSIIMGDSHAMLDEVALALRMHPTMRVRIEGHTDERGAGVHNDKLSQSRADAVKAYLVQKKVDAGRLQPQGFGAQKPIAKPSSDGDEAAHEQNRRVEFVITES